MDNFIDGMFADEGGGAPKALNVRKIRSKGATGILSKINIWWIVAGVAIAGGLFVLYQNSKTKKSTKATTTTPPQLQQHAPAPRPSGASLGRAPGAMDAYRDMCQARASGGNERKASQREGSAANNMPILPSAQSSPMPISEGGGGGMRNATVTASPSPSAASMGMSLPPNVQIDEEELKKSGMPNLSRTNCSKEDVDMMRAQFGGR